jgi:hypothetical protein
MFEKILYDCHCLVYKSYKLPAPLYTKKNLKQVRLCLLFRGLHACKPVGPAGKVASRSAAFVVGLRRRQVYKWKLYITRLLPTRPGLSPVRPRDGVVRSGDRLSPSLMAARMVTELKRYGRWWDTARWEAVALIG